VASSAPCGLRIPVRTFDLQICSAACQRELSSLTGVCLRLQLSVCLGSGFHFICRNPYKDLCVRANSLMRIKDLTSSNPVSNVNRRHSCSRLQGFGTLESQSAGRAEFIYQTRSTREIANLRQSIGSAKLMPLSHNGKNCFENLCIRILIQSHLPTLLQKCSSKSAHNISSDLADRQTH